MAVDFEKIIKNKVSQMENDGSIEKRINDDIEKLIYSAIDSAIGDYGLKRSVESSISANLGNIVENLGMDSYTGFILQRVKAIIADHMNNDFAEKVSNTLKDTIFAPVTGEHKLSDIFKKYHAYLDENVDLDEKYECREYLADLAERKMYFSDGHVYTIKLGEKANDDPEIIIEINDNNSSVIPNTIRSVLINGMDMSKTYRIGYLDEFQRYVCQLYYNKCPITIDEVDVNDFGCYEIDD